MANRIMLNETSYHGAGAIQAIPGEVKSRGYRKALVCCGPTLLRRGVVARVTDLLDREGLAYAIFSDIKPNPTIENVTEGVRAFRDQGADYLTAIAAAPPWTRKGHRTLRPTRSLRTCGRWRVWLTPRIPARPL